MQDKDLLKLCLQELCEKMGYVDTSKLSQADFEHLCYLIEEQSKILISLSTMRRIFYGQFERLPQLSTLNALTTFIGYSGWLDFKTKKRLENSSPTHASPRRPKNHLRITKTAIYCAVGVGVCVAMYWLIREWTHTMAKKEIQFTARKVVAEGVPNSVVFNYDISMIGGDSFFIQPSWNKNHKLKIDKNIHTRTAIYYEPGYHNAKLIANGTVLKEIVVHIPSPNWMGYSKVSFFDSYTEYLKPEYIIHDNVLGITTEGLRASNVNFEKDKIYYYAYFPPEFNVHSDNFRLKARVRMSTIKNTLCPWIISEVYGEKSIFYFMGTIPGCISQIGVMVSDQHFNGQTTDLSAFGYDVTQWQEIEINVQNKNVTISIGARQVFEKKYLKSAGLITGLGFGSNGLCEVDYVEVQDSIGNVVYKNDFAPKSSLGMMIPAN